jgi:DNA recombination protein RmuC
MELVLLYLLIGIIVGALVAYLWLKLRSSSAAQESGVLQTRLEAEQQNSARLEQQLAELKQESQTRQEQISQLKSDIARLETQLSEERKQSEEKLKLLDEAKTRLNTEFENLANRILEEKSKKFTEQNRENIDRVLNPLREQLGDFRRKVEDVYEKESKDRMSLFHEIKSLKDLNLQISEDALNLTNALKGQTKTQGTWGEVVLERVLEESGLHNGREYETQGTFTSEEGKRLRPDVIVHLPEDKDIIIDSKVSLTAYERYCTSEEDAERQAALKEHITSLRTHIKGLSVKNYEDLPGIRSLDFVLLFVPIEAAFITAVENDRDIFREAFDKNIIVVSPTTLLATLKTVHNIWRYEYQNRNALEIADRAGSLYDQFVLFMESMDDIGDKLGKASDAYHIARRRLVEGRGNLIGRTEKLKKLGAKAKKALDEKLLLEAAQDDDEPA